jgi:DNA polymerase III delta subunit
MRARMLREKGESDTRIANVLRIPGRHADDFFVQLASVDIGKIRSRMRVLLEADLDLKRTKYDPALILEFAVIRMWLT